MKYTNMRAHDRETLVKATAMLEDKPHGSLVLCQVREAKKPTRSSVGDVGVPTATLPDIIGREFIDLEELKIDARTCAELQSELK